MSDDVCPSDGLFEHDIPANPKLTEAGWVRRYLADPIRAREAVELYSNLGYEVLAEKLTPDDFGPNCDGCPSVVCASYVMIHTRKCSAGAGQGKEGGDG
jgi:hypothetical protein